MSWFLRGWWLVLVKLTRKKYIYKEHTRFKSKRYTQCSIYKKITYFMTVKKCDSKKNFIDISIHNTLSTVQCIWVFKCYCRLFFSVQRICCSSSSIFTSKKFIVEVKQYRHIILSKHQKQEVVHFFMLWFRCYFIVR